VFFFFFFFFFFPFFYFFFFNSSRLRRRRGVRARRCLGESSGVVAAVGPGAVQRPVQSRARPQGQAERETSSRARAGMHDQLCAMAVSRTGTSVEGTPDGEDGLPLAVLACASCTPTREFIDETSVLRRPATAERLRGVSGTRNSGRAAVLRAATGDRRGRACSSPPRTCARCRSSALRPSCRAARREREWGQRLLRPRPEPLVVRVPVGTVAIDRRPRRCWPTSTVRQGAVLARGGLGGRQQ